MSDSFKQKDVHVTNGNNAGRDLYNTNNYTLNPATNKWLTNMLKEHAAAARNGESTTGILDEFKFFCDPAPKDPLIGLEGKLLKAGRTTELESASRYKEIFAKRQAEQQFIRFAQDIYAHLMSRMFELFTAHVIPAIQRDASPEDIDSLISDKVINALSRELADADVQFLSVFQLRGMLYYLIGNCHLRLHPQ